MFFHSQTLLRLFGRWSGGLSARLGDVTREVGHLLAFANSGERKDAHSRGPSNLKIELGLSLGKHGQHGEKESRLNRQRRLDERAGGAPREAHAVPGDAAPGPHGFLLHSRHTASSRSACSRSRSRVQRRRLEFISHCRGDGVRGESRPRRWPHRPRPRPRRLVLRRPLAPRAQGLEPVARHQQERVES